MRKILSISFLFILVCTTIWAFSAGTIPKPFCKASEATTKIEKYFKDWFLNESPWVGNPEKESKVKAYEEFFLKELTYTHKYTSYFDVSKTEKNRLDDWSWVAVFINYRDLTNTYTVALKKDGSIEIIGATD